MSDNETPEPKQSDEVTFVMNAFLQRYQPAASIAECDAFMTSDEIISMFESVALLPKSHLLQALKKAGFLLHPLDTSFCWLLKDKTPQ